MSTAAQFSGTVPPTYDGVLGPVLFEPYARDIVSRLPAGKGLRVLELACGTGIVTRRLQEALSGRATITATDLNEPMIEYARAAIAASDVSWRQADAQSLPFEDGSQDVVVCQFGYMFLPDKVQGFRESRRVLAAGGTLIANVWTSLDANPFARAMHDALAIAFPDDPPRFLETPYGYEEERVRADMDEAGWEDVRFETLEFEIPCRSASHFSRGFSRGSPLTHELIARGVDLEDATEMLARAVIPVGGEQPFMAKLSAFVITAAR
jgi:SAM-dependent methyltransferase